VLLGLVVVVVIFGVALVVFGKFLGDELFGGLGYGPDDTQVPEGEAQYVQFTYGVMGALMAGWMVTLGAVVVGPLRHREAWAWWAIAGGVVTWFVPDSLVAAGVVRPPTSGTRRRSRSRITPKGNVSNLVAEQRR